MKTLWRAWVNTIYSVSGDEAKRENRPREFGDAADGSTKIKLEGNTFTGLASAYILSRPRHKTKGRVINGKTSIHCQGIYPDIGHFAECRL